MTRRTYKTTRRHRELQMIYRDRHRDRGVCINSDNHGPATHGCRCERCHDVHRRSQ